VEHHAVDQGCNEKKSGKIPYDLDKRCHLHDWRSAPGLTVEQLLGRIEKITPQPNIGLRLGNGIVRLDIDSERGEDHIRKHGLPLPDSWEFASGRGRGILYRVPADKVCTKKAPYEDVELLGDGQQTVIPPSRHVRGTTYQWKENRAPTEITLAAAPDWIVNLMDTKTGKGAHDKVPVRNGASHFWSLSIEEVLGTHEGNFPSPFHDSEGGQNSSIGKGVHTCWRHAVCHTPLEALAILSGVMGADGNDACFRAGKELQGPKTSEVVFSRENIQKMWSFAKARGMLAEDDPAPFGEDRPKKGRKKEQPKYAAFRQLGEVIYRQCVKDGVCRFARYDRGTKQLSYVDKIAETGEVPVPPETAILATFPRELRPYGTPLELYRALKERFKFVSDQTGHKNHIVVLYLMETGCSPPWKRKNFQLILIGLPAAGKGRFVEMCQALGDRARLMTSPKEATNQRLNELLGGGLEIIDEMPAEDEELEKYIRSRYDPGTVNPRLLDPHSRTDIAGFRVAGPTVVTRRRPFIDDANTDRGILIRCEQGNQFPLEVLDKSVELDLQDELAMFWTEYYDDERLLPTQEELMFDRAVDDIDPRLKLATTYLKKLAALIGAEAAEDLHGFVQEQELERRRLKALSEEGKIVRALYELITSGIDGNTHTINYKYGSETVNDTLFAEAAGPGTYYLAYTRTPLNGGADGESKTVGITWSQIARMAALATRLDPKNVLQPYSVEAVQRRLGPEKKIVRTISINAKQLDWAFRTFIVDYDPGWRKTIAPEEGEQANLKDFVPPNPVPLVPLVPTGGGANCDSAPSSPSSSLREGRENAAPIGGTSGTNGTEPSAPRSPEPATQPSLSSTPANGPDAKRNEEIVKRLEDLQRRACPNGYEYEVEGVQAAINRVIAISREGRTPGVHELYADVPKQFPGHEARVREILENFGAEIVALGVDIFELREAPR
jgi:hypothetical protein